MKIIIIGSLGMLGTELIAAFAGAGKIRGFDLPELDITDAEACRAMAEDLHPDLIVNAAAVTAVDWCETHEDEARRTNATGPGNLAAAAGRVGARLVHYSTDYVFDGRKIEPYQEDDPLRPMGAYARSKAAGEELVRAAGPEHVIIRTSWLFGRHGKNFVRTIVESARQGKALRVVHDQRGCPTCAADLAVMTRSIAESGGHGIYHVTNRGACSWFELARFTLDCAGLAHMPVQPVTTAEYPLPAPRPANSVLGHARLEREGFEPMRPWQEAVREYVRTL